MKGDAYEGLLENNAPKVIAAEIVEDFEAALEQFRGILGDMNEAVGDSA